MGIERRGAPESNIEKTIANSILLANLPGAR
jgi:hypothetical protein